jgi:serine/threonine protein kinase
VTAAREEQDQGAGQVDRRWLFGAAVLDERTLELHVEGKPVDLERKSLQVLMHLLSHAGEVVTKDEMLAAVWPGRILSDSVITSCMARLRDALRDDAQSVIKTVHGFGYRLIAPVKVEAAPVTAPARFEFKPGEHLPARPLWSLIERLGTGGHGEAWLARHDKTKEKRVYKFAADSDALVTLKREITIYRLLHDSLGDRPDFVHLLDWNLEEPPYFLEYDYLEAGSLSSWAKAQGGLDRIPLAARLDIAAQIADALGAAHSVGVLHKDLKPSNVLIEPHAGGAPQIKLCDFGSGGVLDVQRLERMGITRLGFTHTVTAHSAAGSTPVYLAPEVISGQPFTVKSDIYALGVLLYQLAVGNFHKPLAPGWELDVADEVLREDIALAAEGHPERRIADAGRLAQRLRTLDERRRTLAADRATKAEAESARLQMERMRARRGWVRLALAALVAGVTISSLLYVDARRSRDAAAEAAATSKAVSEFLSRDLFASVSADRQSVRDLTVKQVLDTAALQIDKRFGGKPDVAAELHASVGGAYSTVLDAAAAVRHMKKAIALYDQLHGEGSEPALRVSGQLISLEYTLGELPASLAFLAATLRAGEARLGAKNPDVLQLKQSVGLAFFWLGEWQRSVAVLEDVLTNADNPGIDVTFRGRTETLLGLNLRFLGDLAASESRLRSALDHLTAELGTDHLRVAAARGHLADVLVAAGRLVEADTELNTALAAARRWVDDRDGSVLSLIVVQARLRLEQDRIDEAIRLAQEALGHLSTYPEHVVDQSFWFREVQAEALQRLGRLPEAESAMRAALASAERTLSPKHPFLPRIRIGLADMLRERGEATGARLLLQGVAEALREALPERHPYFADLRRVEGLLWRQENERARANEALGEALRIYEQHYGVGHGLTRRARQELARVSG